MSAVRDRFARIGNALSTDFANTVVSFEQDGGSLHSADDVIDFLLVGGALAETEAARARDRAAGDPTFLTRALRLRAAVTAALRSIEGHVPLPEEDRAEINAVLRADTACDQLVVHDGRTQVARERVGDDALALLAPVARDIARLLSTPDVPVRKCAADDCVRHFYDDSRTKRRRWCDMAICGNRAKVAAFSARRAGSGPG